jgi:Copper type II ascorbate-dependent monooxygenase, C-terminal domain
MRMRIALALCVLATACGGGDGGTTEPGVDAAPDPVDPDGYEKLMEGSWTLQPGQEAYFCIYSTVPRDIDIKAFRPLAPPGTHHTVLTKATTSMADGIYPCNVGTNGTTMIYGSGVGAPDFAFPPGIGLRLAAGTRLLNNLHLYNATDQVLTGKSGSLFKAAAAGEIENFAELVLAGPTLGLTVPTGTSTQQGTCSVDRITNTPIQVFALSQHMHKLGKHMKSVVQRTGSPDIVLQDIPYDFEMQQFHHTPALVELRPGDKLVTHCTFDNTTGATVSFGESSDDEMCFTDLYYYPAKSANYICTPGL